MEPVKTPSCEARVRLPEPWCLRDFVFHRGSGDLWTAGRNLRDIHTSSSFKHDESWCWRYLNPRTGGTCLCFKHVKQVSVELVQTQRTAKNLGSGFCSITPWLEEEELMMSGSEKQSATKVSRSFFTWNQTHSFHKSRRTRSASVWNRAALPGTTCLFTRGACVCVCVCVALLSICGCAARTIDQNLVTRRRPAIRPLLKTANQEAHIGGSLRRPAQIPSLHFEVTDLMI